LDASIDLNKTLIKNKDATFYGRVKGDSMIGGGLSDGDLLIIDKSIEPKNGKIAVCFIDGEFTVKRIKIEKELIWLIPENKNYQPIKVTADNDFVIWGIVTNVIKAV
jgi:DNA polymerase V